MSEFKSQHSIAAFAHWNDFYSNDDVSKLFFIKVDFDKKEVNFYHKQSAENQKNIVFRNAKETAKTIRVIKEIFSENSWAKYLSYSDIDLLRKEIVTKLTITNRTFLDIKKDYLQ